LHFVAAWKALNCWFMMEAISWKSGRISSCIVKCSYGAVIWMLPTGQFIVGVLPHSGPQDGQCEAGKTMDFLSGSRIMHTYYKTSNDSPNKKEKSRYQPVRHGAQPVL